MLDRTPTLGLAYTGDAVMNANLDRLDTAVAKLAAGLGITFTALFPPPPTERTFPKPADLVYEAGDDVFLDEHGVPALEGEKVGVAARGSAYNDPLVVVTLPN